MAPVLLILKRPIVMKGGGGAEALKPSLRRNFPKAVKISNPIKAKVSNLPINIPSEFTL